MSPSLCLLCVLFSAVSQFLLHDCVVGVSLFPPYLCGPSSHCFHRAPVLVMSLSPLCSRARRGTFSVVLLYTPCHCSCRALVPAMSLCPPSPCVIVSAASLNPLFPIFAVFSICRLPFHLFPCVPFFRLPCRYWNLTTVISSLTCTDQDHFHVQAESDSTWIGDSRILLRHFCL